MVGSADRRFAFAAVVAEAPPVSAIVGFVLMGAYVLAFIGIRALERRITGR